MRVALLLVAVMVAASPSCSPRTTPQPASPSSPPEPPTSAAGGLEVPFEYHKLDNGLKVVLSPERTSPTVTVAVYYHIGFRIEPRDRTGFAHLFEHMMFQGSENLGKMEFIKLVQASGGSLNGSTRFDFTNYYELAPANTLQTLLWAEADRMSGLAITEANLQNQQGVVKNEVKVNVVNQPYGGFPWIDLPMAANTNWFNAHNFYGEMDDLDAASLADVRAFFDTYYRPNNAVVVIVGDFDPPLALSWVKEYFGSIPGAPQPPRPDVSEPRQDQERRASRVDPHADRPALAVAYHMPPRGTPEHHAMVLIEQILSQGDDSLLYEELVRTRGLTGDVWSAINPLGNAYNYEGPMLYTAWLFHDADRSADTILAAIDASIERLRRAPVDAATLDRAKIKLRSWYYDLLEDRNGFGRADLLACFALFDDDPGRINELEAELLAVTPELVHATAREYLRPGNRTVFTITPGKK